MNKYLSLVKSFLTKEIVLDQKMIGLNRERRISIPPVTNYIRISTLELVAEEIYGNNVAGSIAELGVYKGNFAKYMNKVFPEKKFYLFDTFEGFEDADMQVEKEIKLNTRHQNFENTSVQLVLSKMINKQNCVIKKGWFPDSLEGLEDNFCFVSLDADLYKPIYEGLEYFYPRLNKGGYIFIHDFNNKNYEGAKTAVKEFCKKMNIGFVPMSDTWGSAIIAK
jgi:O-methyltransferase